MGKHKDNMQPRRRTLFSQFLSWFQAIEWTNVFHLWFINKNFHVMQGFVTEELHAAL